MGQGKRLPTNSDNLRPIAQDSQSDKMGIVLFINQIGMGNNLNTNRINDKQQRRNKTFVHIPFNWFNGSFIKRLEGMATAKMMFFFMDFLGVPIFAYTAFLNFGDFKGYFLFFIAGFYGLARLVFFVDKQIDESKMRKLQLKKKEHDVNEDINEA